MVEMGSCQPNGARVAQIQGIGTLRHRAFYPCAQGIPLLKVWCLLPLPCGLKRQMHCVGMQRDLTRANFLARPLGSRLTDTAICRPKLDLNSRFAAWTALWEPGVTDSALRTDHPLCFPLNGEPSEWEWRRNACASWACQLVSGGTGQTSSTS